MELLVDVGSIVPSATHEIAAPTGKLPFLGDYRIIREVGRGGMGIVYEAEQVSLRRKVALKVLPFAAVLDKKMVQRFRNEAHAAAQLHHTNIVPVYSVGCEGGVHYYAMQYIEGQALDATLCELHRYSGRESVESMSSTFSLAQAFKDLAAGQLPSRLSSRWQPEAEEAPSPPKREPSATSGSARLLEMASTKSTKSRQYCRCVASLAIQAAEALQHAHELGVVHRDIKPSNMLLDERGNLWITDFGLARVKGSPGLTLSGDLLGTLRYMSPEQALAKRMMIDHRTDIYSLGVTLYELLTLRPVFRGRDREEVLRQIAFEEPRAPRRENSAVPAELQTVVLKAMEKNPENRYGSAQDLADDLRRFLEDKPIVARRPKFFKRAAKWCRRRKALVAATATIILCSLTVAVLLFTEYRRAKWAEYVDKVNSAVVKLAFNPPKKRPTRTQIQSLSSVIQAEGVVAEVVEPEPSVADPISGAITELEQAVRLYPHQPDAHYHLARALKRRGQIPDALDELSRCGKGFPPATTLERAIRLNAPANGKGQPSQEVGLSRGEVGWEATWLEAHEATAGRRWQDAGVAHGKLIAQIEAKTVEPYVGMLLEVRLGRARARLEAEDFHGALLDLGAAQALLPGLVEPGILVGLIYHRMGKLESVEQEFERLWAPPRDLDEVAGKVTDFYCDLDEYEKGLAWARKIQENSLRETYVASCLTSLGRLDEAIKSSRKAIAFDPTFAWAHNTLGSALRTMGDLEGAIAAYREAVRVDPRFAAGHENLGIALTDKHDLDAAIAAHKESIRLHPDCALAHASFGFALHKKADLDAAIAAFKEAIRLDGKLAWVYDYLGLSLSEKGDLGAAIAAWNEAIHIDPRIASAPYNLGRALREIGDLDAAVDALRVAIHADPCLVEAQSDLGNALQAMGNEEAAIAAYREAIRLDASFAGAHTDLGLALAAKGDLDGAITADREAIRLDAKSALPHINLGVALEAKGELDAAMAEYEEAIRLDPKSASAQNNLAIALHKRGELDAASAAWKEAVRLELSLTTTHYNLGAALHKAGDLDGAFAAFSRAAESLTASTPPGEQAAIHCGLGVVHYHRGSTAKAIEHFRLGLKFKPDYPLLLSNLAFAFREEGQLDDAICEAEKAVKLDPKMLTALYSLAWAFEEKGEADNASAFYRRFQEACAESIESQRSFCRLFDRTAETRINTKRLEKALQYSKRALALRKQLADRPEASPDDLGDCARALLNCEPAELRDDCAALAYAKLAVEMTQDNAPRLLDLLARAYFLTGSHELAIETQEKAVALLATPEAPEDFVLWNQSQASLTEFEKALETSNAGGVKP
jgi:tetratricopeptide (TPR) repeat protein